MNIRMHRRWKWIRLCAFALLCAIRSGWAATPPQDLYKEAQLQESAARDPEAAVLLYVDFLRQPGTDRASQAKAYLHIGLCQDKLGHRAEAKAAYRKVVQD